MTAEKIRQNALRYPERTAYSCGGRSITYGRLWEEACKYAEHLKRITSSSVIIIASKSPETVTAIAACLISGLPYVPLDPAVTPARLEDTIKLSGAELIISDEKLPGPVTCCSLGELTGCRKTAKSEYTGDTAYIIFTSGSTGKPKGVPVSRANLENFVSWISSLEPLCGYEGITVMNQASFAFDLSVADLYYSLCGGHTLISPEGTLPGDYENVLGTLAKADAAVMTPTFMKMLLLEKDFRCEYFPLLGCVFFCGERLDAVTAKKLLERFPGIHITNAYGPTEAACAVCSVEITDEIISKYPLLPVGEISSAATEIRIENGEIVLRGKSVFSGYLGEETGGYFSENGVNCFRTGDLGYTENGLLFCSGRRDNQIKLNGFRIEAGDIENNICKIPGALQCCVVPVCGKGGEAKSLTAYVVAEKDVTAEYIKAGLEKLLPGYMIPKKIVFLNSLPVTRNGKTDRKKLMKL